MNKRNLSIVVVLLIIGGLGWFYTNMKKVPTTPEITQVATTTSESISNLVKNINYSQYEKPLLFTEQEGRYKNLTSEEKLLVQSVFTEEQFKDLSSSGSLEFCQIISFKDGVMLVAFPTVKASFFYKLYNIKNNKLISDLHYSNRIQNSNVLVLFNSDMISYIKPGMKNIAVLTESKLQLPQTYIKFDGAGADIQAVFLNESTVKASIFDGTQGLPDGSNKKIKESTFVIK